jgi:hypothetical protein
VIVGDKKEVKELVWEDMCIEEMSWLSKSIKKVKYLIKLMTQYPTIKRQKNVSIYGHIPYGYLDYKNVYSVIEILVNKVFLNKD